MAGLPWIRLDTDTFSHPKILEMLSEKKHQAVVLHLAAMCYAGKHGTGGHIPKVALRVLPGRAMDVTDLVKAELWHIDAAGWRIHGWEEYQLDDEERQKRRQRARKGGCIKNHGINCGCWKDE
ncbi:hypothetical protein CH274_13420 [Rhodococcus sp. 06-418-5]|uniref:hypothetical protein n=1 Tax=Rhodococcus sp. 06-418-5 TaxID=2022507 RepID=UPI000B9BC00C|nr:hypothetical protein [Rhodococcus sp. 06-418-5]OZC80229.1 hypothetical protein CH274_13420 [Rhodococcus sp. 06-418-5]